MSIKNDRSENSAVTEERPRGCAGVFWDAPPFSATSSAGLPENATEYP